MRAHSVIGTSMKVLLRVQGKISEALVLGRLFEDHGKS